MKIKFFAHQLAIWLFEIFNRFPSDGLFDNIHRLSLSQMDFIEEPLKKEKSPAVKEATLFVS